MKVAVCFFGLCQGSAARNIASHKRHFPYDFFYGTWKERSKDIENLLPGLPFISTPEPKMHYHPVVDTVVDEANIPLVAEMEKRKRWALGDNGGAKYQAGWHRTKQHIGHAYMLSQLPPEYDMIIRARFDVRLSPAVDFGPYIERSYTERRAIGFMTGGAGRKFSFDGLIAGVKAAPTFLHDLLLMHPRDMFDLSLVQHLHDTNRLAPSEAGWWQILSYPYGANHLNITGGANLERWEPY